MDMRTTPEAEALFSAIAESFKDDAAVRRDKMFSASGLRVGDKFFAMTVRGGLVLKLPKPKVDDLIAAGLSREFGPAGRVMKEWLFVPYEQHEMWADLARQSREYVAALPETAPRRPRRVSPR